MGRRERGVCLITGGGRGIGAATSRLVAEAGWSVVITWTNDEESAVAVAEEVAGLAVRAEVSDPAQVEEAFRAAAAAGPITAAVANAGIVAPTSRIADMDPERMRHMVEVNTLGAMFTIREALRHMETSRGGTGGSIVAVSSVASRLGSPGQYVDYAASKGAVDSFVIGAAKEAAGEGVRVNAVLPGIIDTTIHADSGNPDRPREVGPSLPMGRAGTADEVAEAIVWLLGDQASYVTGALLDVTGAR